MRVIGKVACILALFAVPSAAQAQAASTCLTQAEATAMIGYVLPDLVAGACEPLPPTNLARLIGIIIAADGKGSDASGKHDFQICA